MPSKNVLSIFRNIDGFLLSDSGENNGAIGEPVAKSLVSLISSRDSHKRY